MRCTLIGLILAFLGSGELFAETPRHLGKSGHEREITAIAFSPDGKSLLTGSSDGTVRLWDVQSGKERLKHVWDKQHWISSVAFSPDGKTAAVGAHEEARLFDLTTGKLLRELKGQAGLTNHVAFTRDGKTLVTASSAGTLRWWDVATGERRRSDLLLSMTIIYGIQFDLAGKLLLDGSDHEAFQRVDWTTKTPQLSAKWLHNKKVILSRDSRVVATVEKGEVQALHVWELNSKLPRLQFQVDYKSPIRVMAFSLDGRQLATSSGNDVLLWDLRPDEKRVGLLSKDFTSCWLKLSGTSAAEAFQAIVALASVPDKATPFLERCLRGQDDSSRIIRKHIADLDHPRFPVREKAMKDLLALGDGVRSYLNDTLELKPTLEVRRRIELILEKMPDRSPLPHLVRELRAVEALERIATKEARAVLQRLVESTSETRLRQEATAALERLRAEANS